MNSDVREFTLNGVVYVPKENDLAEKFIDGLDYKIVRTRSAGAFAGYIKTRSGMETVVIKARRLWYWKGAASLSQLAVDGVSCPDECKFPVEVSSITLTETIEILDVSAKAQKSIAEVKVWNK